MPVDAPEVNGAKIAYGKMTFPGAAAQAEKQAFPGDGREAESRRSAGLSGKQAG